jgi:hypothetical protein
MDNRAVGTHVCCLHLMTRVTRPDNPEVCNIEPARMQFLNSGWFWLDLDEIGLQSSAKKRSKTPVTETSNSAYNSGAKVRAPRALSATSLSFEPL